MSANPNHAVTAAYSPRTAGPATRATMTPPRPAAAAATALNAAVLLTWRPAPGQRSALASC